MDEYERYENELRQRYHTYVVLFRNMSYLQEQLLFVERAEREMSDITERTMRIAVEKMRIESELPA